MESSFQLNKEIRIFVENLHRKNMARNKRFVWEKQQSGLLKEVSIIIDAETGVNYMFVQEGYAGGLTPLLDKNGKPVITPPNEIIEK